MVAEADRSGSVSRTARRYGVKPRTLAWWRWTLGREGQHGDARLLPVVVAKREAVEEPATAAASVAILVADDIAFVVPVGVDVTYVAALVVAVRSAC